MPLYTLICTNEHTKEVICKHSDLEQHMICDKISCRQPMVQDFTMKNKPLVQDYDLIKARNYNGK